MSTGNATKENPNKGKPSAAAPGTVDEKAKKEKVKKEKIPRVPYPVPEGGLADWPTDFDAKKHKPLGRKDFAKESVYLLKKAEHYEKMAKDLRHEAETGERLGGLKDKGRAKKLLKLQEQFDALKASLQSEGIDVAAILAGLTPPDAAK
jgi:hypothetical protein